jgi:photosystem II stability/assembly factor-like uncharacterized protein
MKSKPLYILFAIVLATAAIGYIAYSYKTAKSSDTALTEIEQLRNQHEDFFKKSPFHKSLKLNKTERKAQGLPPNNYNERMWELTMNPRLGFPTPYVVDLIDVNQTVTNSVPGNSIRPWEDRGPNNVGGRTRVAFYDPNDVGSNNGDGIDYNRVFAGGVGGGLWVNDDITSATSSWNVVTGIAANLNVSCYAIDPNDSQTFYLGTGEQYTSGAAVGNGVYKSTDGGATWTSVNIQPAGGGNLNGGNNLFNSGLFYVNDIAVRNNSGASEVYIGVGASIYYSPNFNISNPTNVLGLQSSGLYRSTDDGANWNRIESSSLSYSFSGINLYVIPNDFEISADNTLYFGSISAGGIGEGGGRIYKSTDGVNWSLARNVPGSNRVELAASSTNADLFYVLGEVSGSQANVFKTTDDFTTLPQIAEPNDADLGIPATDFTRNQAFYDLVVEVDPTDDQIVYAGGIDLHQTTDGGSTWTQISKWAENANLNTLNVPFIHADIHWLSFHPTNSNQAIIGSDGGISWASDLASADFSVSAISTRNLDYNVTQFYYGAIAESNSVEGFLGGAQDNGSQGAFNATPGANGFVSVSGGDGGHVEIDADSRYAISTFQYKNHQYRTYPGFAFRYCINGNNCQDNIQGDFINVAELDKNVDYFYSNSTNGSSNVIEACELLTSSANCTDLSNSLISNSRPTAMKASPFNPTTSTLYVGTQLSGLVRITNANTASPVWTNIAGPNFLGSVSDIEFGDTEQEIFVTMHNYGVQNIWYSTDGGASWTGKEGDLPDLPVKAILKNPLLPNEVVIGTEAGIYATGNFNDASPNWVPLINGMTNVKVVDLDLRDSDNTILATTHGRGMFTGTFDTLGLVNVDDTPDTIKLYPTQISDGVLFMESTQDYRDVSVRLFNLAGQEVLNTKKNLSSSRNSLDVNTLKPGYYIVQLNGNGLNKSQKILVQ